MMFERWVCRLWVNECMITVEESWTLIAIYEIRNRSVAHVPMLRGFYMCSVIVDHGWEEGELIMLNDIMCRCWYVLLSVWLRASVAMSFNLFYGRSENDILKR